MSLEKRDSGSGGVARKRAELEKHLGELEALRRAPLDYASECQPHEPNLGSRATGRAVKAMRHRHPLCTGLGRPAGSCLRWLAQPGGYCGGYNAVGP